MELRSCGQKDEAKYLREILLELNLYEDGMQLQEMRQLVHAVQMSSIESETLSINTDMSQALRESELSFNPAQYGQMHNSTMLSRTQCEVTAGSSTNIHSDLCFVEAQVHHAMNWSPSEEQLPTTSGRSNKTSSVLQESVDNPAVNANSFPISTANLNTMCDIVSEERGNASVSPSNITRMLGPDSEHGMQTSDVNVNEETEQVLNINN